MLRFMSLECVLRMWGGLVQDASGTDRVLSIHYEFLCH